MVPGLRAYGAGLAALPTPAATRSQRRRGARHSSTLRALSCVCVRRLFDGVAGIVLLGLWLFCLVDVIVSDQEMCRNLPKMLWLVIVLILPDVGSLLWLILGRPQGRNRGFGVGQPEPMRATSPDDDEAFMQQVRLRAEQQRQRAREQQRDPSRPNDE